jgi:glycosyltransferase involved in cell wall biosynthesis
MSPLVSILIPCFNSEHTVGQAIESALAQTWPTKEVIVVDDGSRDRSLVVIRRFDGLIRWETGPNRGANATRNRLLELAHGEWLQYLDADDYLRPGKITRQIEFACENPRCDIVYGPVAWERIENGAHICTETPIPEPRDPWILLALWRLPQTGGALWKKVAVERVGGWRIGQPCCQEHELYFRLLQANAQFEYCGKCLAVYRDHEHNGRITRKSHGELERQRLSILDRIEKYLDRDSKLTSSRRQAINDARHELARTLWKSDQQLAMSVHQGIVASDPSFLPTVSPSSPSLYLTIYRVLGFRATQIAASWKRAFSSAFSS